jgi:flagellar basal-body rod protein FlgG
MNGAFYIGAIGLDAQQRALEVVANNVANINTTAFKRSAVRFSDLTAPLRDRDDAAIAAIGPDSFQGVSLSGTPMVWTQGTLQHTGQQFDLAINGDGFIELAGPSGHSLLWRGGGLKVNSDGLLATADGTPLRGMIAVPQGAGTLTIGNDGKVSTISDGDSTARQIGQIELVTVKSPEALADTGNGYYEIDDESQLATVSPGEEGSGVLVQGSLEASNSQLADEMTNVLLAQRAFGANAQVVQAGDQIMSIVNQLRR